MAGRLDKVRDLKLEVPDETSAPARRWGFRLFLAVVVAGGAFLALKKMPLQSSAATVVASDATLPSAAIDTPAPSGFTAASYVEPIPPFPIHVSPLMLGRIDEFTITEGQPVKAGQIIGKLNSQEFEKRLAELQAAVGVDAARLAPAESELVRSKKLAGTGAATGKELEQASADTAVLRAEAAKLQAEIQTVEWQIQQTEVRSPVDGVLFERLAQVGTFIYSDSNREIASIYDPANLQIWVEVNQRDVARLHVGQRASTLVATSPTKRPMIINVPTPLKDSPDSIPIGA